MATSNYIVNTASISHYKPDPESGIRDINYVISHVYANVKSFVFSGFKYRNRIVVQGVEIMSNAE